MTVLTKFELAKKLTRLYGISGTDARQVVDSFYIEIRRALSEGEHCSISGFGKFTLRDKKERPGRNPKTGESVSVSARRVVTFKPSPKFKSLIDALSSKVFEHTPE